MKNFTLGRDCITWLSAFWEMDFSGINETKMMRTSAQAVGGRNRGLNPLMVLSADRIPSRRAQYPAADATFPW
jgi:hypothetical protein